MTFIAVAITENTASINTAYIYSLYIIITWESTGVCKGLMLLLHAVPLMMCISHTERVCVCVCVFRKIIRIIFDYLRKQQELFGPSNGG